jgi:hypothetical protein
MFVQGDISLICDPNPFSEKKQMTSQPSKPSVLPYAL